MISRLRAAFGGRTSREIADAAVGRGMADVLAALDNVIDDDVALGHIYAVPGTSVPGTAPGQAAGVAAGERCARTGLPGPGIAMARPGALAASRRRLAVCSVAGVAATLTAGAVALAAIGVPSAGRGGTERPAVNTAYVVKRVDGALSAADPGAIAQMTVTTRSAVTPGGMTVSSTAEEWSYGHRWNAVIYSPAGHLAYDAGVSAASLYTVVSYRTRAWAHQYESGHPAELTPGPRGCGPAVAALPLLFQPGLPAPGLPASSLPATVAGSLRAAISCGAVAVAGRQRVAGIEAIELTSRPSSPVSETIWVSPGTYLPVRAVIRPASGQPGPWQTADITWLAPTAQNLANLTVPIPAGFRQIPLGPILHQISRGSAVNVKAAP